MAKQGAKKMKDENKKRLDLLLRIILISNAIYIVLASMAKPVYSDNGELLDGGFDLSTGGVCEYLYDVIYITVFVQLMSIISEKFWWTYLVIPAFAGYKIFGLLRGTFFSGGSEGEVEDEKTRKKREKMEKKASRGKVIKTRTR
ncbi:unnamed protein product [Urochloa humidicola]